MKASDLRVGNIFSHHSHLGYLGDIELKAESIVLAQNNIEIFNQTHCPYKISDKWLIGFGFTEVVIDQKSSFLLEDSMRIQFNDKMNFWEIFLMTDADQETYCIPGYVYVHQLQNLCHSLDIELKKNI